MCDHVAGMIAAQSIGFALYRREKTGHGESIEVPMLENMAAFVLSEHMGGETFIPAAGPSGDNRLLTADYRPIATSDGYVTISPNTNAHTLAFFECIGRPELKSDPRFTDAAARTANADVLFKLRIEALAARTTDEWLALFAKADIPAARYNSIDDLFEDPHLADVGFFSTEQHPSEGEIRRTRIANTFSGGMREKGLHAPRLGEHTREVLAEVGLTPTRIDAMLANGAAVQAET